MWTPEQIRAARQSLNLTQSELGRMLDTDGQTIRRMEGDPSHSTFRKPAVRMERLIRAYLDGYRPADWPVVDAGEVIE
jgi:predicted transcriptional regulator